jgi:hypothetical protein
MTVDQAELLPPPNLPTLDIFGGPPDQTPTQPTARALRHQVSRFARGLKRDRLKSLLPTAPAPGECLHVVSGGRFDSFGFVELLLDWIGTADELWASTWIVNKPNADALLGFYDRGKIRQIWLATGSYFVRRDPSTAAYVRQGLEARGQRFTHWPNHTKL